MSKSHSSLVRRSIVVEGLENRTLLSGTPVSPPSVTLQERADQQFTAALGSFTAVVPVNDVATINWGDGITSLGTLVTSSVNGLDTVQVVIDGTHTYTSPSTYTININVFGKGAVDPLLHITDEADVSPAVGPGGVIIREGVGVPFTAVVGSFTALVATDLRAVIDWGDGTASAGTLIPSGVSGLDTLSLKVQGAHDYAKSGIYDITVNVFKSTAGAGASGASGSSVVTPYATIDSEAIVAWPIASSIFAGGPTLTVLGTGASQSNLLSGTPPQ